MAQKKTGSPPVEKVETVEVKEKPQEDNTIEFTVDEDSEVIDT
jgi:hypothetical protein